MPKPSPSELSEAVGISNSYASMILSDEDGKRRVPPPSLAIRIYRKTEWRHESIAHLTSQEIDVLERLVPWTPKSAQEAA